MSRWRRGWSAFLGVLIVIVFVACTLVRDFASAAANDANLYAVYDQTRNASPSGLEVPGYFIPADVVLEQTKVNFYKACSNYVNSSTNDTDNRYGITFNNNSVLKCLRHEAGKEDGHRIFGDVETYSIGVNPGYLKKANTLYSLGKTSIDIVSQDAAHDRFNESKTYDVIFHITNIKIQTGSIDDTARVKKRDKNGYVVKDSKGRVVYEREDTDTSIAIAYGRKGGNSSFAAQAFYLHQKYAVGVKYNIELELVDHNATDEANKKPKKTMIWMLADIDIGERLYNEDADTEKTRKRYTYYQDKKVHEYAEHVKLISGGLKIKEDAKLQTKNNTDWHENEKMIPVSMVKGKDATKTSAGNVELGIAPDGSIYHRHLTHASNNYVPTNKYSGNVTDNSTDAMFKFKVNDTNDPFKIEWGGSSCGTLIANVPYKDVQEDYYYNYELKPYVTNYSSRAAYIGGSVTMDLGVAIMVRKDSLASDNPKTYATITKETEVKYSYYFTDKSGNLKGSVQAAHDTDTRRFNEDLSWGEKIETNELETFDPVTVDIPDSASVGDRVCVELSVYPFESHDGKNDTDIAKKETSGITTRRKATSCLTVAKRPTMSVESSNVYSATTINTSSYDKKIGSVKYRFGSWSEYGVFGRINNSLLMASGAAFGYDRSGYAGGKSLNVVRENPGENGNVATANNSGECALMTQTFANVGCVQDSTSAIKPIGASAAELFHDRIVERYRDDTNVALTGAPYKQLGGAQYVDASNIDPTANAIYDLNLGFASVKANNIYLTKTPTFAENDREHNHTVVYHATNLVIDGDLNDERTKTMVSPWNITGAIIIADNVYLTDRVNYVNATIIAKEVNTCAFRSSDMGQKLKMSDLNSGICNKSVVFDQPVVTKRLILNRTAGANSGTGSVIRAEVFNFNSGNYLWSYGQMSRYSQAITSSTRELPPRY